MEELKTRGQLSTIDEKIAEVRSRRKKVGIARKRTRSSGSIALQKLTPDPDEVKPTEASVEDESYEMVIDRKSTRLNSSHITPSRMPSSA